MPHGDNPKTLTIRREKEPTVCVIMANYNGKHLLERAIDSLTAKTSYSNYQLVVVDNGSIDGSANFIAEKYPWIKLIRNSTNLGYSKANNQGIKACKADYYLLLNTDIEVVSHNWLTNLLMVAESDSTVGIVTCSQPRSRKDIRESNLGPYEIERARGSVFLIKKETIENIGLLDEIFTPCLYEDTDWCYRAKSAGWKILCDPKTQIIHFLEITTRKIYSEIAIHFYLYVRNRIIFETMNHPLGQLLGDMVKDWKILCLLFASALFKGTSQERNQKLRSLINAYLDVAKRLSQILYGRRTRQSAIKHTVTKRACDDFQGT